MPPCVGRHPDPPSKDPGVRKQNETPRGWAVPAAQGAGPGGPVAQEPARRGERKRSERVWLSSGPALDPGRGDACPGPARSRPPVPARSAQAPGWGWGRKGRGSARDGRSPRSAGKCVTFSPSRRRPPQASGCHAGLDARSGPLCRQLRLLPVWLPQPPQGGGESQLSPPAVSPAPARACLPLWSEASWDLRVQHPESADKEADHAAPTGVAGVGGSGGAEVCTPS